MPGHRMLAFSLAALTLCLSGCVSIPKMRPDVRGIGDLGNAVVMPSRYASTATLPRRELNEAAPAYRVGANDELTVYVMGRDDLGSQIPINTTGAFGDLRATIIQESGEIVLPLLGPIQVAGQTIEEIRTLVEGTYARRIASSNVDIIMQECRSQPVHVTGAVNQPGTYYLCNDMRTLNDVLSAAQWLSADAYPAGGVLTRNGRTYGLSYPLFNEVDRDLDILLQPGDAIYFPKASDGALPTVHVFGMVRTQGTFPIPADGLTLLDAMGLAQGALNDNASVKNVYVMRTRPGEDMPTTYRVSLDDLYQGPPIPLVDDDRIYVAPSSLSRWDAWWRLAIPFSLSVRAIGNN